MGWGCVKLLSAPTTFLSRWCAICYHITSSQIEFVLGKVAARRWHLSPTMTCQDPNKAL